MRWWFHWSLNWRFDRMNWRFDRLNWRLDWLNWWLDRSRSRGVSGWFDRGMSRSRGRCVFVVVVATALVVVRSRSWSKCSGWLSCWGFGTWRTWGTKNADQATEKECKI